MRLLYTIGISLYTFGIRVAALFGHRNARLMVKGWRKWRQETAKLGNKPMAWFHASSLGEFEQARPVLERYRELNPEHQVLLTFFSPSGYEVRKKYASAEAVCYLPPDLPGNAKKLIGQLDLRAAFFVKYDFWFNYLITLRNAKVPTYIFSAIFRPGQYFFKPWGRWFLNRLRDCYTHIFVQNDETLNLLREHGVEHCSLAGDTRFDRVHQIAEAAERDEVVEAWLNAGNDEALPHPAKVLVCGSTWPPDEELIAQLDVEKIILAPHVIGEDHLSQIERLFTDSIRYSAVKAAKGTKAIAPAKVLIIDNIGLLSKLYRYAHVAYIGGGFGSGIHNILEAVTFGKPVLFGPNYRKFKEAHDILAKGGGFTHADSATLQRNLAPLMEDDKEYGNASQACTDYMNANLGSTGKILSTIEK